MSKDLQRAAKRLEAAKQAEADARRETDKARSAWRTAAGEERHRLLGELLELADAIGVVQGERTKTGIVLSRGDRSLAIDEAPDSDRLLLEYAAATQGEHLQLDHGAQWWWERGDRSFPFLGYGIEQILVRALGLPDPGEGEGIPAREATSRPAPAGGEPARPGRSGTRSHKPSRDLPPGSVVKDLKGPGPG